MYKHNLLFILMLAASALAAQTSAKKYVLIEHFTNSNCSNCGSKNPAFYNLIDDYPNDIHHISIHPPIPYASCALYQANKTENSARAGFYNIFGTPSVALNGELQPISSPLLTLVTLQNYLDQTSPMWVQVSESGPANARQGIVKLHSLSAVPGSGYKLYVALVEKTLEYKGTNSETVHHDVFRDMLTDVAGVDITPAAAGQSIQFTYNYDVTPWNDNEMYLLAWVQKSDNKEVLNSGTRFDPALTGTHDVTVQTVRVRPNPVTDQALVQIGDDRAESLEVFSANGQRVTAAFENQPAGTVAVSAASLAPGIYFLKMRGEKGAYVAKMVKE